MKPDSTAQDMALHVDGVRAQVDAVLNDELYWFPVRHHSPAVARHLDATIHARRPKIIFIEGPHEANDLIKHLIDAKTKPPIAIYSSYRDDDNTLGLAGIASPAEDIPPRFATWFPLLDYSPELVAIKAAHKIGAESLFIDLPHYGLIQPKPEQQPDEPSDEAELDSNDNSKPSSGVERQDELLIVESGFYQALAQVAGFRSWNEAWDTLFEADAGDAETFRRELATFCAAARTTSPKVRLLIDGTVQRERFMRHTIHETLKQRKLKLSDAMVVCGGFHLFLDRDDSEPPPDLPAGTVYTTVVPYSFFRVSELSGYAAGNRAPQYYQRRWDLTRQKRADDILAEHVVAVLTQARKDGLVVSSADAIAISGHARLLARLRGRPEPILDDIHDAIMTCCCKGDPVEDGRPLRNAIDTAEIGTQIGRVTPKLGQLPIVNDFYAQMRALDLGEVLGKEKRLSVDLDKRDELAERRSVFLHRLVFLEVPLASVDHAPTGDFATGRIFREKWALRWSPQVETALIEKNLYGDSVETAVLARLREDMARDEVHAGRTCARLVRAVEMDLPDLIREVQETCGNAIDQDPRFVSLSQALGSLTVLERYAIFRNLRVDLLEELIVRCFDRACFAIPEVASVPEDQQQEVVNALLAVAEIVLRGGNERLDRNHFVQQLRQAAADSNVPFLRGVFLGMLSELRDMSADELAAEVSALAKAPTDRMVTAGDFLEGVMAVSRTSILLGADALVGAIDELLRAAEWEPFLTMLPRLRAAFERLHGQHVDSLAARVAQRYGLAEAESLTELRTSVEAAAWIVRVDREVAKIMKEWEF